jgi:hypothetical protein
MAFNLTSHHAYIVEGSFEELRKPLVRVIEEEFDIKCSGNPDVFVSSSPGFGIDEARALSERASRRPVGGGQQIFVIGAGSLTREAQNALLKTLEEPGEGTHFFLVIPNAEILLPTLRSRCSILARETLGVAEASLPAPVSMSAPTFLAAPPGTRLTALKSLIEAKDAQGAVRFLSDLERALRARSGSAVAREDVFYFETLARCRSYLSERSPSVKMILEYLASVLPRAE